MSSRIPELPPCFEFILEHHEAHHQYLVGLKKLSFKKLPIQVFCLIWLLLISCYSTHILLDQVVSGEIQHHYKELSLLCMPSQSPAASHMPSDFCCREEDTLDEVELSEAEYEQKKRLLNLAKAHTAQLMGKMDQLPPHERQAFLQSQVASSAVHWPCRC